ncbi:CU044_2847 family protein [Micromonospora sp. NPDC005205]|uniref:CU044_2847 family protein n=1 Tax=Micromonospora sp. NPDC005205 TaxID=3156714 RepID=UPI0033A9BA83
MIEPGETSPQNRAELIEVQLDDHTLFVLSENVGQPSPIGHEVEIAGQSPSLDGALDAVTELAQKISSKLQHEQMSKITVEFGFEFAVNSGSLVAVIGKASTKSAFKVTLEWSRPEG